MRQHFAYQALLALLLTAALAGCQREPLPESGGAISFSVAPVTISGEVTKAATKADPTAKTDLVAVDKKVTVYGSYTAAGSSVALFDGVELKCTEVSGTGSTWTYSPLKYWSEDATHKFRAVYPYNAADKSYSVADDKLTISNYSMATGYDLMVASAQQPAASRESNTETLKFRHACAAVRLLFGKGGSDTQTYSIKNFTLQNIYKTGTLNYVGASKNIDVDISEWTPGAREASAFVWTNSDGWSVPAPTTEVPFNPTDDCEWLFVVPQELTVTGTDTAPTLSLTYMAGSQEMHVTLPLVSDNSTIKKWLPGKMYTYKVLLNPNAIKLSVGWTDWPTETVHSFAPIG